MGVGAREGDGRVLVLAVPSVRRQVRLLVREEWGGDVESWSTDKDGSGFLLRGVGVAVAGLVMMFDGKTVKCKDALCCAGAVIEFVSTKRAAHWCFCARENGCRFNLSYR